MSSESRVALSSFNYEVRGISMKRTPLQRENFGWTNSLLQIPDIHKISTGARLLRFSSDLSPVMRFWRACKADEQLVRIS
jgi:hypothetical protein